MQSQFDFNPLDVLAAAAALQSAENVPANVVALDGKTDDGQEEGDDESGPSDDVKNDLNTCVNGFDTHNGDLENKAAENAEVSAGKCKESKLSYTDMYELNNKQGKEVLRILKENNHENISHYLDHSYASFTPNHELIAKVKELTKNDVGSETDENEASEPNESASNCLQLLLSSDPGSRSTRNASDVTESLVDVDGVDTDIRVVAAADEAGSSVLTAPGEIGTDSVDHGAGDTVALVSESEPTDAAASDKTDAEEINPDVVDPVLELLKHPDTQNDLQQTDSVACLEPEAQSLSKAHSQTAEQAQNAGTDESVGTVLHNGYIQLVEPDSFVPTSRNTTQTLLLVRPDGICNSVLVENSNVRTSIPDSPTSAKSVTKAFGGLTAIAPRLESKLLLKHPNESTTPQNSNALASPLKNVCDNDQSGLMTPGSSPETSLANMLNGRSPDTSKTDGMFHLRISGSSLTTQPHCAISPPALTALNRSPRGKQRNILSNCTPFVSSPKKDKLPSPSDPNMKHLRIAGGVVIPEFDPSKLSSSVPSSAILNYTPILSKSPQTPSSPGLQNFVPLSSLQQSSPLTSLSIGFPKHGMDIGQVSPLGSDKSHSNLSSPSIASPLSSPRDPSLGGKRNAFMTNKDICIGLHCSSPSDNCVLHRGLCVDRPSSVSSQDNSMDGLTECGSPGPILGSYRNHHSAIRAELHKNRLHLLDSESNSECDYPSNQSSRNPSPDSKKGRGGVHKERISAEHDYLSVFGKPRPPGDPGKNSRVPAQRRNNVSNTLPLNNELADQLLKLKPGRPPKNSSSPKKSARPKTPKQLGLMMKRGLYIPTGPLVVDADKRGEHPLKDHDYCLHAFYQAMTFNTVDEGPRRPGPVPKAKVKKEKKKKTEVPVSVSDSNEPDSPDKKKKRKYKKSKKEGKNNKKKKQVEIPTSAETSDNGESAEMRKTLDNIKKEPIDFSDLEDEILSEEEKLPSSPKLKKYTDRVLRKDKKMAPGGTRKKDEDRVKIPGTLKFQDQFIYFATKKPRRRARPIIGDPTRLPKAFTGSSEFLPGLDSSYVEARAKFLGKLGPDKTFTESETESTQSGPITSMADLHSPHDLSQNVAHDHLDLPSDFMTEIPHGKLAVGISEEESQFIHSLMNTEDQEEQTSETYPQDMDSMGFDLTNEQVRDFFNTVGVEKAMKLLGVGETGAEETVQTGPDLVQTGPDLVQTGPEMIQTGPDMIQTGQEMIPVPEMVQADPKMAQGPSASDTDTPEHMISSKDPHLLPTGSDVSDINSDVAVSISSAVTSACDVNLCTPKDTIAGIRESLELESEAISIKSSSQETETSARKDSVADDAESTGQKDLGSEAGRNENMDEEKSEPKDPLNTSDLGFTNIATDTTPHDLFDLDDDDLLNANLNFVNMNMILNFQSPEKINRAQENNHSVTKMRKIDFDDNANMPSNMLLPPVHSPLVPKSVDTASIDSDISMDSTTQSSHLLESTRPMRNNPFSIGKPNFFKSGMLNRLHTMPDPTDSGVPELIFVNMFWNDLPGLLINGNEYVRLVDIHKQVLPAKPTGLLKNRCRALKLEFENCSELQRDFLIRYAHAAQSRSTLIVTKTVAETLIGYYVNPPPRSSRIDLRDDENDLDTERYRPRWGGRGRGRGKRSRINGRPGRMVAADGEGQDGTSKVTLKLKDCRNFSRLIMPKKRLVGYSTSEESSSSSDDDVLEIESEATRQQRIRKIIALRRRAKRLKKEIMFLTGEEEEEDPTPPRKQNADRKLQIRVARHPKRTVGNSGLRSGRTSASSSRRSSVDYSRRKVTGKSSVETQEAEKRTERAIYDIDATIDEVLGNLRRQCEAEEEVHVYKKVNVKTEPLSDSESKVDSKISESVTRSKTVSPAPTSSTSVAEVSHETDCVNSISGELTEAKKVVTETISLAAIRALVSRGSVDEAPTQDTEPEIDVMEVSAPEKDAAVSPAEKSPDVEIVAVGMKDMVNSESTLVDGKTNIADSVVKSNTEEKLRPLPVIHRDSLSNNGKRSYQTGELHLHMFSTKSSECIQCTNCSEFFAIEDFLRHLHAVDTSSLVHVKAMHTLDIRSNEPSEQERSQWQAFKTKCKKFDAETLRDEKNGKNGNKVKTLQFEVVKPRVIPKDPSPDVSVRQSTRVRKRKQLYPIEKYMFVSGNLKEESDDDSDSERVQDTKSPGGKGPEKSETQSPSKKDKDGKTEVKTPDKDSKGSEKRTPETRDKSKERTTESNSSNTKASTRRTQVMPSKKENHVESRKVTPPTMKYAAPGQRVSLRESTSQFKRLPAELSKSLAKKRRFDKRSPEGRRNGLQKATSPVRSSRRHSGDKTC